MRPVLQALAQQQQIIADQARAIHTQGVRLQQLTDVATSQRADIARLGRGLKAIATMAGVEPQIRTAMLHTADEQNPTQPVPEPPAQPAPFSTQQAETPEAMDNVLAPGMTPGSTKDVAADATSTVYTPGTDIPGPPLKNLVDVTAPVDGTQGPRPINEVRTETDVRAGNPMAPAPAFPLRGDFANPARMGSVQNEDAQLGSAANPIQEGGGNRTMAALRVARLRIEAGMEQGDDFEVATRIEKDAGLSDAAIEAEIITLNNVKNASVARVAAANKSLVPKAAGVHRTVPSMAGSGHTGANTNDQDVADADLFY